MFKNDLCGFKNDSRRPKNKIEKGVLNSHHEELIKDIL